ncbi:MAG: penicillin-binding protein 2 [Acidobacteriota bacterium]
MKIYDDLKPLESRLAVLEVVLGIFFGILVGAFWVLQVLRNDYYCALSEENRIRESLIAAPRGLILDRNHRVLVENRPSFSIVLVRENMRDLGAALEKVRRIPFLDINTVLARLHKYRSLPPFMPIVIKEDVGPAEVAFVEARRLELPELAVKVEFKRYYRTGGGSAHILGYVSEISERQLALPAYHGLGPGDLIGQAGIERRYDSILRGTDGKSREVVNSKGRKITELERVEPAAGRTIVLSVDTDLMDSLESAMSGKVGSGVVLDTRTGEVLAMVSLPGYDPNSITGHCSQQDWVSIVSNPDHPLQNRAINNLYSPGSVFKLTVAIGALEEGVITPSTTVFCPGSATIYGHTFHCWKAGGHGSMNLRSAITNSCNVYFYQVGKKLGIEKIAQYAKALGFGSATGIDLPGEEGGLVPDPDWKKRVRGTAWYAGETISIAIGQGSLLVSPMQMAYHAALIASSGRTFKPHLLHSYYDTNRQVFPSEPGEGVRALAVAEPAFDVVRDGMWGVVNQGGTGGRAAIPGMDVCGKTGTVQLASKANIKNPQAPKRDLQVHSWFIGFAPRQKPEVAIAVFIEHGGAGGEAAAPVAKAVLETYFELHDRSKASS